MEKVSVILPIYNVEKYLKNCIESLTNQTYENLEIILVDDGSKDNSPQICEEYATKSQSQMKELWLFISKMEDLQQHVTQDIWKQQENILCT